MSTNQEHNEVHNTAAARANGGTEHRDFEKLTQHMTHEEKRRAVQAGRFGYGPLAHMRTHEAEAMLPGKDHNPACPARVLTRQQHLAVNSSLVSTRVSRTGNLPILHRLVFPLSH